RFASTSATAPSSLPQPDSPAPKGPSTMSTASPKPSSAARRILALAADDPQLQQLMPDETVLSDITREGQTLAGIVSTILSGYGARPALGERVYKVDSEGSGPNVRRWIADFATITYAELERRVRAVATVWQHDADRRVEPGQAICFLGFASTDYVTLDLA